MGDEERNRQDIEILRRTVGEGNGKSHATKIALLEATVNDLTDGLDELKTGQDKILAKLESVTQVGERAAGGAMALACERESSQKRYMLFVGVAAAVPGLIELYKMLNHH